MSRLREYIDLVEAAGSDRLAQLANHEKWNRETLEQAGVRARVWNGRVYVRDKDAQTLANRVLDSNPGLRTKLPVLVDPQQA